MTGRSSQGVGVRCGGLQHQPSPTFRFAAPGTYTVTLMVTDNDAATDSTPKAVTVTAVLHGAIVAATTKKWTSPSGATNYWSGAVTVAAHGADERPIAGATITAAWTGGVTKTSTCITARTGNARCNPDVELLTLW